MRQYYKNAYAEYRIEAGILFLYYTTRCLSLHIATKVVQDRLRFQIDTPYPIYCDVREIIDSTKEARDYLLQEGSVLTRAIAFRIDKGLTEGMLKFYLLHREPHIASRYFYEKDPAIAFLKKYREPKQ